ncbi:hypothetical protein SAMN05216436_1405 [bacterium A37T11]|nr:hypothetical protein SAMN05216436_1405 [bacterium A37T11]
MVKLIRQLLFYLLALLLISSCTKTKVPKPKVKENLFYDKAFELRENNQTDSSFLYFYKAKDLFLEQADSLGAGKCLVNMAIFLTEKGDYYGGQETAIEALKYLDERNPNHFHYLGSNYNNLGLATFRLQDFNRSLVFYNFAVKFSDDPSDTRVYLNNKAKVYQRLKNYKQAINIYRLILAQSNNNQLEYARILTNLAVAKWLQNPHYPAAKELLKAFQIRQKGHDLLGMNSSYGHLADFYALSHPDSAIIYARNMNIVAQQIKIPSDQIEALQKLIKLCPPDSTKQYFQIYQHLRDSVEQARNADKNQFALIRFEVEKNKAENLKLQKDNADKAYQITRQRLIIGMVIFLACLFIIGGTYWYKKRKQRLELESQNQLKAQQLKTSKKIHDVVANGIYRVMTELENKNYLDRDELLDKLEDMYEKSRDISYETEASETSQEEFNEKITRLLTSFATESVKVIIAGNESALWEALSAEVKYEVEQVLQELMVNMRKHSQAGLVAVRFEQQDKQVHIYYVDNGVGMSHTQPWGNGLRNTGNRINSIGGELTFDGEAENGLKIHLSFPIA